MSTLRRDRIAYSVGSESNPGDPFGRSQLVIEADGQARLDQHTRSGHTAWTGRVTAPALDQLWRALEEAAFPAMPDHRVPPGSALRALKIGIEPAAKSVYIAWHASGTMPGYRDAFWILDSIIRQLSEDSVKAVAPYGSQIVEAINHEPGPATVSPGTAFSIAYLAARRIAHTARLELLDRNAATIDPALKHTIEFSRQALKVEESRLRALPDIVRPHLTTAVLEAAWQAGETGRLVAVSAELAAHIAYLRCAAQQNADLRAQAAERARDLKEGAARLTKHLQATRLPLVISHADSIEQMVNLTSDLEPTTTGGYRQLNELVTDIYNFLGATVRQLDTAPPPEASAPLTAEEERLFARIVADPSDYPMRRELAALAEKRSDPRARLIYLQTAPAGATEAQQAYDLVRSHPEWTGRLRELGARDVKFAGGFPEEITIDADALVSHWSDLRTAAPLTRLKVRGPKGYVRAIVGSPSLATIEALDLDSQEVTDDDLAALGANPNAARLRQLDLRYNPISERGIEAIAASPYLRQLRLVNLDGNPADPVDRLEYHDETRQHAVPTDGGKALEAKYGRLPWLHPH